MMFRSVIIAAVLAGSSSAVAGVLKDETDRFTGSRVVAWNSIPQEKEQFSLSAWALFPKGASSPYSLTIQLMTHSDRWQYLDCHHTDWLVDGVRDSYLEMDYSNTNAGSAAIERFTKRVDRQNLERLSAAKLIEFKVCGTEGAISAQDMEGLRRFAAATR